VISRYRHQLATVTLALVIALAWEGAVRAFAIPTIILPAPSAIALNIFENFDKYLEHAWVTSYEILIGFAVGALFGIGIALAMLEFPAIAPLLIIWFGVGILPKIMIVALLALFPVLINTVSGFESTERGHLDLLHSVDASKRQVYWHIRFPTALPYIFAGLKLAITVSVIGAIVGEWVASTRGLGYLLLFYTQYLDMVSTFAVLIVLVVLGVALFGAVAMAERAISWETKVRRQTRVEVAEQL
jgi:ABC-type nitrate/sulfonate/bicarbonate transport system permease component